MSINIFDPSNISKDDMKKVADSIDEYLDQFESVMVIPDDIMDECKDEINTAIKTLHQLVKKLRKGDKSVFKDMDD